MRFDLMPCVSFLDDDGTVRLAQIASERDGRVVVFVTRGVGMRHVLSRPADRVAERRSPARPS